MLPLSSWRGCAGYSIFGKPSITFRRQDLHYIVLTTHLRCLLTLLCVTKVNFLSYFCIPNVTLCNEGTIVLSTARRVGLAKHANISFIIQSFTLRITYEDHKSIIRTWTTARATSCSKTWLYHLTRHDHNLFPLVLGVFRLTSGLPFLITLQDRANIGEWKSATTRDKGLKSVYRKCAHCRSPKGSTFDW